MHNKTIAELSAGLSAGEFSSVELTEACIQRISTLAGRSNCFITQTPERALEDAKHADQRRATGDFGPLSRTRIFSVRKVSAAVVPQKCSTVLFLHMSPLYPPS